MEDNSIKTINNTPLKNIAYLGREHLTSSVSLAEEELVLTFNFSYKEWFSLRNNFGFSSVSSQFGDYNPSIRYKFTDLAFSITKKGYGKDEFRTIRFYDSDFIKSFTFSSVHAFCGGFQISNFTYSIDKNILNFIMQFALEEYYGKTGSYSKALRYPIYFFDTINGKIVQSFDNSSIEGKLTQLHSYSNPNTSHSVGVYMYQFEQ